MDRLMLMFNLQRITRILSFMTDSKFNEQFKDKEEFVFERRGFGGDSFVTTTIKVGKKDEQ